MGQHVAQLRQVIHEHRLADHYANWAAIATMAELGKLSDYMAKALLVSVQEAIRESEERPNLLPPPPDAEQLYREGPYDITIGNVIGAEDLRWGQGLWQGPQSALVAGTTGFGKTVTLKGICIKILEAARATGRQISLIVFDRKGGDYADLPALDPSWLHLSVHDGLRIGLNAPAGITVRAWSSIVSTMIAARTGLKSSTTTLARMIMWLHSVMNKDRPEPPLWPDLQLLLDVARAAPPTLFASKGEYLDSMCQSLDGLTQTSGDLLRTFNGIDFERDIISRGKSVVLEMSNLSPPSLRLLLVDVVISQILQGRIARHQKMDTTEVVFVIDESNQDISRQSEAAYPDGLTPLIELLREGREFGCDTKLGATVLGNASLDILNSIKVYIILNQQETTSIMQAARTLLLPRGAEVMLPALRKGEAIVRSAHGYTRPMLCQLDYFPPRRGPRPDHYDTHTWIPAKRLHELPQVQAALKQLIAEFRGQQLQQGQQAPSSITKHAHKILELATFFPATPLHKLWEKMDKASFATQAKARKVLVDANMAVFADCRLGKKNVVFIEVLPAGFELLHKPPVTIPGRGKLIHRTLANWIAMVGRHRGHKPVLELGVPGTPSHPVDCAWKKSDGTWHVFEVVVECSDNLASHIHECLRAPEIITDITVVATQAAIRDDLRAKLEADPAVAPVLPRVTFEVAEVYMKELWP